MSATEVNGKIGIPIRKSECTDRRQGPFDCGIFGILLMMIAGLTMRAAQGTWLKSALICFANHDL
ncbi:MAG: hypothetical protein P0107_04885 [Nitrosomonas sp.]|nr:hypothetical protein [Nitrosomonas sp.]